MNWYCISFATFILSVNCLSIQELIQKVDSSGEPKGTPFEKINGPCKSSKIAIIGAGPSGVHMAYSLKMKGFKDVTILERSDRIGGKGENFQYRSIHHFLSLAFWTSDYKDDLVPLLKKFDFLDFGANDQTDTFYYWKDNNRAIPISTATQYTISWIIENLGISDPTQANERVLQDLEKYINLHHHYFGKYEFGLMQRPDSHTLKHLDMTIYEFLKKHSIESITSLFFSLFHTTGYGTIYETPILYGLIWATPRALLDVYLKTEVKSLKSGTIDQLFSILVKHYNIPVIFNFDVKDVRLKDDNEEIQIESRDEEKFKCDFMIWSGLPSDLEKVAHVNLLSDHNRKYFKSSLASHAASSIVDLKGPSKGAAGNVYVQNWDVITFSGNVAIDVDVYSSQASILTEKYENGDFLYADNEPPSKKWTISSFQYGNSSSKPSLDALRTNLVNHYQKFDFQDIEVLYTRTFDYFPRWNVEETSQGYHWDLYDLQGKNNLWFIGGGLSFESVHNVMAYNQLLIDRMKSKHC